MAAERTVQDHMAVLKTSGQSATSTSAHVLLAEVSHRLVLMTVRWGRKPLQEAPGRQGNKDFPIAAQSSAIFILICTRNIYM
jgi:hypothetical protein